MSDPKNTRSKSRAREATGSQRVNVPERYAIQLLVNRTLYEKLMHAARLLSENDDEPVPLEDVVELGLEALYGSL